MTLEEECKLSYYQQIAVLDEEHQVFLVQHTENHGVYVRKALENYDIDIFRVLKAHPVPGIPRIHELIEDTSGLTVIEEYISGESLQAVLNEKGPLPEETVADIIRQLCDILDQLHNMDPPVIHRDIKPSNILLTPAGEVRLLDLDAAKHVRDDQHRDTRLLGTQGYAAPEQYGFGSSGICTDIYSLGVLMNVLLTGRVPSEGSVDGRMGTIIAKCTQVNPKDRYQSVRELRCVVDSRPEETEKALADRGWKRFLPPGFRRGNPICMLFAFVGYLLLFFISASFTSQKENGRQPTIADRVVFFLCGLFIILFSCNYADIWEKTGISRISNRTLKIAVIIALDIIIPFLIILIFIVTERMLDV